MNRAIGVILLALGWSAAAAPPAASSELPIPVAYRLEQAAQVSMLLTDGNGRVVRELLHAASRPAGASTEPWDGLDEKGQPVPAGTYNWKLLATQGLRAEYLLTVGTNPTPRWDSWPGNHGPVNPVAVEFYPILPREFSPSHQRTSTVYKTGAGEVTFDRAARIESGGQDAAAKVKPDGTGYIETILE